jgi:hypothetical protein
MADAQIAILDVIMIDRFPGAVDERLRPIDIQSLGASSGHNVSEPMYEPGTKIRIPQRGDTASSRKGEAILMYAKLDAQDASHAAAAGFLAVPNTASEWWELSADKDAMLTANKAAVCLSAMTTGYYGWFWVGGPAPVDAITGLAAIKIGTNDSVGANALLTVAAGAAEDAEGSIKFKALVQADTAAFVQPVAESLAADA